MPRWFKRSRPADPPTLGHYKITGRLGAGGMGVVYEAYDERLGRSVAIKMIHQASLDPRARERLRREARSAARLSHPHICQVHDVGEQEGNPYVVMELLQGESLAQHLARAALPAREVMQYAVDILGALTALHRQGIVHRDLKPANIFLTPHGIKLLDFGLSRPPQPDTVAGNDPSVTATGMIVGTPRYMAPEQLEGREPDARCDLFALGAILYEMASGAPAFPGETPLQVLRAVAFEQPAALAGSPALDALNRIIARALAKDPAARYPSAEAMREDLTRALTLPEAATAELAAGDSWKAALGRRAWHKAYELLANADRAQALGAEEIEALGEAAFWTGHYQESIAARQRAYAAYLESGNSRSAAMVALALVHNYYLRLGFSVAAGWFNNAKRLLEAEPECPELGQLAVTEANLLLAQGAFDAAIERARAGFEIGRRYGIADLQAIAMTLEGFALAKKGSPTEGVPLLDEAMASAQAGRLGPMATGIVYCRTIRASLDLFDYRRASEWTQAIAQTAKTQGVGAFPGDCRAARATLLLHQGEWAKGEQEAQEACDECSSWDLNVKALATYNIGEIRRRSGDFTAAEAAYYRAHEMGLVPQPGLALLRLAQGKPEMASIAEALEEAHGDRLKRARLLPAQVEIALHTGDIATARDAALELAQIAADYGSTALRATADCVWGEVLLAAGDFEGAVRSIRNGCRHWLEVEAPYELARARMVLSRALQALGDSATSAMEARAALSQFERLGAVHEVQQAAKRMAEPEPT